jgi:hypothetical protein
MDINSIANLFFRQEKDSLSSYVSNILSEPHSAELLKMKDAFDGEKNIRGGCSACRLRSLTSKYKPLVVGLLDKFDKEYAQVKAGELNLKVNDQGQFIDDKGQIVNEQGETRRQNRRRRRQERENRT